MSGCDLDTLESLAFDELTPTLADAVRAHVAACPACAAELGLLRAERRAFAERARDSAPLPLPGFSAALALSRWSGPVAPEPRAAQSPGPVPAKAPLRAARSRFTWATPAFAVAAAAAFAGLFLMPPRDPAQIASPTEAPILAEPAPQVFCRDEAYYDGITAPPRTPTTCEMPEHADAGEPADEPPAPCGSRAHDAIDTSDDDSRVTEACYPPLPD